MSGCEKKLEEKDKKTRDLILKEKEMLGNAAMDCVNAGDEIDNPNSECPFAGKWDTSLGYVCEGQRQC